MVLAAVCTNFQRLFETLIHELCHAGQWLVLEDSTMGHGATFRYWYHYRRRHHHHQHIDLGAHLISHTTRHDTTQGQVGVEGLSGTGGGHLPRLRHGDRVSLSLSVHQPAVQDRRGPPLAVARPFHQPLQVVWQFGRDAPGGPRRALTRNTEACNGNIIIYFRLLIIYLKTQNEALRVGLDLLDLLVLQGNVREHNTTKEGGGEAIKKIEIRSETNQHLR